MKYEFRKLILFDSFDLYWHQQQIIKFILLVLRLWQLHWRKTRPSRYWICRVSEIWVQKINFIWFFWSILVPTTDNQIWDSGSGSGSCIESDIEFVVWVKSESRKLIFWLILVLTSGNSIGDTGAQVLAAALKENKTLQTLNLYREWNLSPGN